MEHDAQDLVYKALADEHRRKLLDLLFQHNGQTLMSLCDHFEMTRHGVMKHLRQLEEAGLITTRKVGREKYHYLNPVPIQEVYNRWVSKYAQPWASGLAEFKAVLEQETMDARPTHVFQTYIRTTPERLWQALTDGTFTRQYYLMNATVESSWQVGAEYRYRRPDGSVMLQGEILEIEPPFRLKMTFNPMWLPEDWQEDASIVTFEIEPQGTVCQLTLLHENLHPASIVTQGIHTGWSQILASLKSLIETGEPLNFSET